MNRRELIAEIAEKNFFSKKDTEAFLFSLCQIVGEELKAGRKVQITGFGTFEPRYYSPRKGKKPQTGEAFEIKGRRTPGFRAGKGLKEIVRS